jgi:hypothetical protein
MALSFLVPNRTVLLISDDALYIYSTTAKKVTLVEVVPWDAQNLVENVAGIIAKDCGKKPVLLLSDMVEQHYRKERIVRSGVNAIDRSTMLGRRLSVALGKYAVRAALPLKEKIPKVAGQPGADIYLFAAIPDTPQLDGAIGSVKKSMASIAGLCLLPVESASMVHELSQKLSKKTKTKAVWSVFVGQHKSGNLRQVITKNGDLALTRMSPFSADPQDVSSWSNEVYKEFRSTMSYLSRFGYDPDDGLDLIVIANESAGESLDALIEETCNLHVMSVGEAASTLGFTIGVHNDGDYADILHIAWASRKSRFTLPMKSGNVDRVHKPRQIAMAASLVLLLGGAFQSYQFTEQFSKLTEVNSNIESVKKRRAQLDVWFQRVVQEKEAMGFDVRLVQSALAVYEELEASNIPALDVFKGVGAALGKDLRIDSIVLKRPDPRQSAVVSNFSSFVQQEKPADPLFDTTLKMTYPGTTDVDRGNQEVLDLSERLGKILPDHKVEITKLLKDYEYTEGLVVETGDLEDENLQQDFVAEIRIDGPPKREAEQP